MKKRVDFNLGGAANVWMRCRLSLFLSGILAFLLAISGCAPKVHRAFESNRYLSGFSTYLVNEDLGTYFRSPGDIDYTRNRAELEAYVGEIPVNGVLFHGRSNMKPLYELFVLVNPGRRTIEPGLFEYRFDTVVRGRRYVFLGRGMDDRFPESDFRYISKSLTRGKGLPDGVAPLNDLMERHAKSGKFLEAYTEIAGYPASDRTDRGLQLQYELTYLSMLGDNTLFREKLKVWEDRYALDEAVTLRIREKGIRGKDRVLDSLLALAAGQRLLMFSENHFYPWHRILVRELLPALKAEGYGYLALEALVTDSLLNQGMEPRLATGFYTREQQFNRLLQAARELGFEFVSYEASEGQPDREAAQAANLYGKTFGRDPDARVVVLAGIDHIYEESDGEQIRMAQLFAENYGIDPLTVSQTDLAHYRTQLGADLALINADSLITRRYRRVDYQLVNNLDPTPAPGDFTYTNPFGKPVQLGLYDARDWKTDLAFTFSVPQFSFLLAGGGNISLDLPHPGFRLLVFDEVGRVLVNRPVNTGE
ncbi:hypothetical protein [Robiginitalea sp. SC105]|uniref:hypothetical protein n=1 Tax=Robiginitalea sp. SC105 TaxID=2762332 RepID=UPI001639B298|nr:hypothetical protein [Robiginitalea sp. SC105]MBC2838554.1 hypothetical protein [Robiginitalea sp. SC105]